MVKIDDKESNIVELQPLRASDDPLRGGTSTTFYRGIDNDENYIGDVDEDPSEEASFEEPVSDESISEIAKNHGLSERLLQLMYPKHVPEQVQLLRKENLAIPACYLMVGYLQGLFKPLLNVYPLDLGASESQQTTLSVIATLPCAFKIIYGFISDNYPWSGLRRKPYLLAGWTFASLSVLGLLHNSDLTLSYSESGSVIPPENAPSVQGLSVTFFLFGVGLWFADVMADALVAEKSRIEPETERGNLQATCYSCRFFAQLVSAPVTSYLYSALGPHVVVQCLFAGPLFLLPLIYHLAEDPVVPQPIIEQCREIWNTCCSRAVWQPMAFVYIFNLLQISNAAWRQFLKSVLHFTAAQLNSLLVVSYALIFLGISVYKVWFLNASWRRTYQICIVLNGFFSSMQLLLIRGYTFGLPPFWFALGDEAFSEFLVGIQFLPCAIMMVSLCPTGSEGASYAMFTTVWNNSLMLSPAIVRSITSRSNHAYASNSRFTSRYVLAKGNRATINMGR